MYKRQHLKCDVPLGSQITLYLYNFISYVNKVYHLKIYNSKHLCKCLSLIGPSSFKGFGLWWICYRPQPPIGLSGKALKLYKLQLSISTIKLQFTISSQSNFTVKNGIPLNYSRDSNVDTTNFRTDGITAIFMYLPVLKTKITYCKKNQQVNWNLKTTHVQRMSVV